MEPYSGQYNDPMLYLFLGGFLIILGARIFG